MNVNTRCAVGRKLIQNKKRKKGGIKMCRFCCDKSIILSTIRQHSKSPSGTFFLMFHCTVVVLVVLWDGSLLRGVFILTKAHAKAQPRISRSSTALSSSPRATPVQAASVRLHIISTQKTTNGNKVKHAVD